MADAMTFSDRWNSLPHGGGTAGPRTVGWMERTVAAAPDHAYVGDEAILVALPVHGQLVDLYMAARDAQSLSAALSAQMPRMLAAVGPRPIIVAKGGAAGALEPYGFHQIDELLYYLGDPVPPGKPHPNIRQATEADLPALVELDHASFPVAFQRGPDEMRVHVTESSIVKVYEEHGELIGFTILQPLGERYHLGAIGVRPDRQRQGLGKILFEDSVYTATQKGAKSLGLTTQVNNIGSRRLYENAGMVATPLGPVWARQGTES